MARFTVTIDSDLAAPEAWRRLLDLRAHSVVIPLTTVTGDATAASDLVVGSRFVARTGLGPVGFDDEMVVESIVAPTATTAGNARIRKEGNVVRGRIDVRVTPTASGSVVVWSQRIGVRGVPAALDPVVAKLAGAAYGSTIRRLLARG